MNERRKAYPNELWHSKVRVYGSKNYSNYTNAAKRVNSPSDAKKAGYWRDRYKFELQTGSSLVTSIAPELDAIDRSELIKLDKYAEAGNYIGLEQAVKDKLNSLTNKSVTKTRNPNGPTIDNKRDQHTREINAYRKILSWCEDRKNWEARHNSTKEEYNVRAENNRRSQAEAFERAKRRATDNARKRRR